MLSSQVTLNVINHGQLNIDQEPQVEEQAEPLSDDEWQELYQKVRELHAFFCPEGFPIN